MKEVKQWLSEQDTYTLHKPVRYRFRRRRVVVVGINHQWQADLVDMSRLKRYNDNHTFLLTVIDVFSKKAWSIPLKNKSASSLTAAFRRLLRNNDGPQTMQTDKGKEFLNRQFQIFYKQKASVISLCTTKRPKLALLNNLIVLSRPACGNSSRNIRR